MCECIYIYIYTNTHKQDFLQGQFFRRGLRDLNLEFSFSYICCHTKVKELNYPTVYL